ncbi:hypothetical protein GUITHDRAFT_166803 [Guillardia theta CCMP2712]|uniref:Uncharacterized protein n=2 Tax=Guillardia theta TaxID=55529 RepID=L1I6P7_GUITC|nr:hypothetical protein GUITHDRAFT_166803 [Guillardia theta CCMP2712]EKX31928.1 hypothetical protein GUITHDRAFT_166803 [Guillardia theta CCMP2712]|eukprot:XP_005818908.1 hypothetical protein GUITHDRAFT_166803 [Guillardia theta CCMP2712]
MIDLDLDPRVGLQQTMDSGCFSVEHDTSKCSRDCEDILDWYKRLVDQECTLDSRLLGFREGFHRVPDTSVFFCSRSGLAALSRRLFQFILIIFAAMTGHNLLNLVKRMSNGELQTYRHYNFTVIECRSRALDPEFLPHISSFGMLRDGKDRRFASVKKEVVSEMYVRNGSMIVSYLEAVDTNGFYFVTSTSDPEWDPVRFMVYGSNDLVSWKHIGSSSWHFNIFDFSFTLHNGHFDTAMERSRVHTFDMRTPQPEAFLLVTICVIKTLGLCMAALFGMMNKEIIGKYALVCAFGINTVLNLACAYLDQENRIMLVMSTLFCAAHMIIWTAERRLIESYGILFGLGAAYGLVTGGPNQSVDMEQIFIGLILIIVIYANRYRIISGSRRLVHNDRIAAPE